MHTHKGKNCWSGAAMLLILLALPAQAIQLVSDETIKTQKALTKMLTLKNGIPLVYRSIPDSDIIQILVNFRSGTKDLAREDRAQLSLMFGAMTAAAKGFPKQKVFKLSEKYALQVECGAGIESSTCAVGTINDYWREVLPMFAALIKEPLFNAEDVSLEMEQARAQAKNNIQDPGRHVNDVVNRVFYPENHPYRHTSEDILANLDNIKPADLKVMHNQMLSSSNMYITVVTSVPPAKILAEFNRYFGSISQKEVKHVTPAVPSFEPEHAYAMESREIPTAYISAKFNGIGMLDNDAVAANFLVKLLDEELSDEIRTRRSLSYSVYSGMIQYSIGIGVLGASTSKPEETLTAMNEVIKKLKENDYSDEEVTEQKREYATNYFTTQETHASLAFALANSFFYFGNADHLYEMPRLLDKVSPADVKRLANRLLNNMRLGVVYDKNKFKDEWAVKFIEATKEAASTPTP